MYQYNYFYFCHLFLYGMRHTDTAIPSSNGRQFGKMLTSFRPHDQMIWSSGNHWLPTNLHINSLHSVNNLKQNYDSKQNNSNYLFLFCGKFRIHCNKYHYEKNSIQLSVSEARQPFWKRTTLPFAAMQLKTSSRFKSFKWNVNMWLLNWNFHVLSYYSK